MILLCQPVPGSPASSSPPCSRRTQQAAAPGQAGRPPRGRDAVQHPFEQAQVHAADQVGVLGRQGVERAVAQGGAVPVGPRLEALLVQDAPHHLPPGRAGGRAGLLAEGSAPPVGAGLQGAPRSHPGFLRFDERPGEQVAGQVVLPVRERDRHGGRGAPVELGRPTRTRSRPAGSALEHHVHQSVRDEPVQVESGRAACDARGRRGLVAAHRVRAAGHVVVQPAPRRLRQGGDSSHLRITVGSHGGSLKPTCSSVTEPVRRSSGDEAAAGDTDLTPVEGVRDVRPVL